MEPTTVTRVAVAGAVQCADIEAPQREFFFHVQRAPASFSPLLPAARWERCRVLAQTEAGALRIARRHFFDATAIQPV